MSQETASGERVTRRSLRCVGLLMAWAWVAGCGETRPSAQRESAALARFASRPKLASGGQTARDTAAPLSGSGAAPRDTAAPLAGSGAATSGAEGRPDADSGGAIAPVSHVMLISVDGLGAKYLAPQLERVPGFSALRTLGGSTMNARTDYAYTVTLPNHTSMLTGRPVTSDPALPDNIYHGWTSNSFVDVGLTLHNAGNPRLNYVASVFDVAHDRGRRTCLYSGKSKFSLYSSSYGAKHGAPDATGPDNGRGKIDRVVILENNTEQLVSTMESDFAAGACDLAFIHLADLDWLGHASEWGSAAWYSGLDRVDGWIARLSRFLERKEGDATWGMVLTADHGGIGFGHSDATDVWAYQIPFFVVGPGFTPGSDLYELTRGSRSDPGSTRPPYSAPSQPIRNADAANTALSLLGLPAVPGSFMRPLLGAP